MSKLKLMLTGYNGRMGRAVGEAAAGSDEFIINVGIDINPAAANPSFPVFLRPLDYSGALDVIIDFSHHTAVDALLAYACERHTPLVIATTGHTAEEHALIKKAAADVPVFMAANMSLGVSLVIEMAKKLTAALSPDFDIEIIEKHHSNKLDAPSGTAIAIAEAVSGAMKERPEYVYDRHNIRAKRGKNEVGLHAVRGGTIIGEHEIIFAGTDEIITLAHSARSREIFAQGALRAAKYIAGKPAGMYDMRGLAEDLMKN